jgi:nicotinamidase-related amidase
MPSTGHEGDSAPPATRRERPRPGFLAWAPAAVGSLAVWAQGAIPGRIVVPGSGRRVVVRRARRARRRVQADAHQSPARPRPGYVAQWIDSGVADPGDPDGGGVAVVGAGSVDGDSGGRWDLSPRRVPEPSAQAADHPYNRRSGAVCVLCEAADVMHVWRIEPREYERQEARRGRRHAFEVLHPRRTALVVIDMVPFFVEQNEYARGIVPNIAQLAGVLRSAAGVVAWVLPGTEAPLPARAEFLGPAIAETYRASAGTGPLRDRIWHQFDINDTDVIVEKTSASAFFPGHCELPERLERLGVDTVLVAGTVANVCCESSARDASALGYRVVMVADGNAAVRDQDLNATLHAVYRSFGDVRPTDELIRLLTAIPVG